MRTIAQTHPDCLAMLLNPDIVAVNQDSAALPPRLVSQKPPLSPNVTSPGITSQCFARPLSGGRLAVLLLNRANLTTTLGVTWAELGLLPQEKRVVYDVVSRTRQPGEISGHFSAKVASHDVAFVILEPAKHA